MGGIAGTLVIEGPIDEFLEKRGIKEQFLVLQQIRKTVIHRGGLQVLYWYLVAR
jgi:hypothetical protein